jgi:hypothetical protein
MHYIHGMKDKSKSVTIQVRLSESEKLGFLEAAKITGLPLSSWVRERLRMAAIRELEMAGMSAPFVKAIPLRGPDE